MTVTNENIVVNNGGGHHSIYPVWEDETGVEYVYLNGHSPTKLSWD
jgi:hypothetical protein